MRIKFGPPPLVQGALLMLVSCCLLPLGSRELTPPESPVEYDGLVFPGRTWFEAPPERQDFDPHLLRSAVEFLDNCGCKDGARALVILRNGYLVWRGPEIDRVQGVWSCTKSFTSTALGLLIDDGRCTLETPAKDLAPELADPYGELTLRHFATMTSGYRAAGDEPQGSYTHGPSRTPFIPSPEPLFAPPGSAFAYWDSAMNELANVLTRLAGEPLEDLFRRRIAEPIQMNPHSWNWKDFGPVDGQLINGGSGNNNRYLEISAREMARFGHLFLNRGRWKDNQLVSREWIEAATQTRVPPDLKLAGTPEFDGRGVYGLNWWTNGRKPDGTRKWPGAPAGTFSASGYNNNDLFVIPEWKLVVVRLGLDEPSHEISDETYSQFLAKLGEALQAGEG